MELIQENGFKPNTHYYHLGDGGHAYHVNNETKTTIYFKCVKYEELLCHGRALLKIGGAFRHTKPHNHPPDPDFVGERHFRENVLHRVLHSRFTSFDEILNQARADRRYKRSVAKKMTNKRMNSAMARTRSKKYPNIPLSLENLTRELLKDNNICKSVDELDNLYAGSVTAEDGSHHVAFFSKRMLQFMANLKIIQGDGTFKARPAVPDSAQCFVLVTTWRNSVVPLGWFLMENKTIPAYRAVFRLLKAICPGLNPQKIISDWEYPQQFAWQEAFPDADIQGCLWHLCRAYIIQGNKLGLRRFLKNLPGLYDYIRKCCVIALLPPEYYTDALDIVVEEAKAEDVLIWYLLRPFFSYVRNKWINNPRKYVWMNFWESVLRTNNSCEVHNRMLRKATGPYHPSVWEFVEALARLEHNAVLDTSLMAEGGSARKLRRWRSIYHDSKIQSLCRDLKDEIFHDQKQTLVNFLQQASRLVYSAFKDLLEIHDNVD